MDGRPDAIVSATATQIAIHGRIDVGIGGMGMFGQQGRRAHDLP